MPFLQIKNKTKSNISKFLLLFNIFLVQLLYLIFNMFLNFCNLVQICYFSPSKNFFFDYLFYKKQLNYFKMGANLDSIIKTQITEFYKQLLNASLTIFDKYLIVFLTKKSTEHSWNTLSSVLGSLRRNFLGIFKLFCYSTALLLIFLVLL